MNGAYVYLAPQPHRCYPPSPGEVPGPRLDDIWRCDCGRYWHLENHWWWGHYKWVQLARQESNLQPPD